MPLTSAQKTAVKADIAANSDLNSQPDNGDGDFEIARLYNLAANPNTYWVWRSSLTKKQATAEVSVDATSFSWTILIARSQGERDTWRDIWNHTGIVDPSLLNIRQGFADIFSGAPGAANRTHLLAVARRLATRIEKLLKSSGDGATSTPANMGFESPISPADIRAARVS